jgi:hypothetical protein
VQTHGVDPETASAFASMFYIGITLGRGLNGFLAMRLSDRFLVRFGLGMITVGVALMLVPGNSAFALTGFVIAGLGCAPIYPCVIHMTPNVFGKEKSYDTIGVPFYVFFKLIDSTEYEDYTVYRYAKTYVPAIKVRGLDRYFRLQSEKHKSAVE